MPGVGMTSCSIEARTISSFLASASAMPSALLIEGEPGIGKTTLWLAALEQARDRGFRVLSARAAAAESVLAYTALADLFDGVDAAAWPDLPAPQRLAVDQVLLRADHGTPTDQRAVAAAFLWVIERLSDDGPVLLAIDDLQWLDVSTMHVVAFAARRLSGPVGFLGSVRTEVGGGASAAWLQMPRPDAVSRIRLHPLGVHDLHAAVSARLRRSFSRPTIGRIHEVSGGNPFYAIELARTIDERAPGVGTSLPRTLAELVRARIGNLDPDVHDALLAASCMSAPTVELVSSATISDDDRVVELLELAESNGIIAIDGNRVHFAHPLLARGVYTEAAPGQRRRMHRRLADIVDEPELRARHLALAATRGDDVTLRALDEAAESARHRGAPAAAAELIDLAIGLGGATAHRQLQSATHHFDAGNRARATAILEDAIGQLTPGDLRAEALTRLAVVRLYGDGFFEVARLLELALAEVEVDRPLRVGMLVMLAYAQINANQAETSLRTVQQAVTEAEPLGVPHLLGVALGMEVTLRFLSGYGLDEDKLASAVELEDPRFGFTPLVFRPTVQHALLLDWSGQLEQAYAELQQIRRRCLDRGEEGENVFIAFQVVLNAIWRGSFAEADLVAEDVMEQARQLGGEIPMFVAHTLRAQLAAYAGQEALARKAVSAALEIGNRTGSFRLSERAATALTFLEVSLGNYEAALAAAQPLLSRFDPDSPTTEIIDAAFLPEAIEALVQLGRLAEAEPLVEALERNGRRLDRPWMLAVGTCGRAMLLAALGDLDGADEATQRAMAEHDRLAMPFERARTLLLLGQLQRRLRRKESASASLQEAFDVFEQLRIPLWSERARAELVRANVGPRRSGELTPSEQRVAELAASGMKNRDVATALFISPKTVEANLARIYRKLGIKSRAELGRHMRKSDDIAGGIPNQ
jgi:DNA-binding CsgD family transcriptional regulator